MTHPHRPTHPLTSTRPTLTLPKLLTLALLCVTLLAARCDDPPATPRTWLDTPQGFVPVQSRHLSYKAVSPDGAVIAVRARPNDESGDLAFWLEVFQREMTDGKGYTLSPPSPDAPPAQDITSADNIPGKLLTFDVPDDRTPYRYQLALFISPDHIVTLETLCEAPTCDRHAPAFTAALKGLRATTDDDPKKTRK